MAGEDLNSPTSPQSVEANGTTTLRITISEETFLKEDRFKVPFQKIGYDDNGKKYFIKSDVDLFSKDNTHSVDLQKIRPYAEEGFREEEAAYKLSAFLGIPMAETHFVEVDGLPWSAARFIEGAQDRGQGAGFTQNLAALRNDLARISIFKFIIRAGSDNGQYLEGPGNRVYVMDVGLGPYARPQPTADALSLIVTY